jgi:hypothetical protein
MPPYMSEYTEIAPQALTTIEEKIPTAFEDLL